MVNLVNNAGVVTQSYDYDAFGVEKDPDPLDTNHFRYCGEYLDAETGRYYLRARYYDPLIGRFTQRDTHWNTANMIYGDNPQKINEREDKLGLKTYSYAPQITAIMQAGNLYVYCSNNPVVFLDTNGKWVHLAIGALVGAAASIITQLAINGTVDVWGTVVAGAAGALSGALAASGVGIGAQVLVNGLIGGASDLTMQVIDNGGIRNLEIDYWSIASNIAIGLVSGKLGGAGSNSNNYLGSLSNQLTNRIGNAFANRSGSALIKEVKNAVAYFIKSSGTTNKELVINVLRSNIPAAAIGGAQALEQLIYEVGELMK